METTNYKIVSSNSNVEWTGRKVTGAHNGTIGIKEGNFILQDGKVKGGKVVIDTASIKILDVTDPATNTQFGGHLASDDFFSIEKFPTATFDVLSVKELSDSTFYLEGNLTIKDITHAVSFNAKVEVFTDYLHSMGEIVIDRTMYNIRYGSGKFIDNLGDKLIYDDFVLQFKLIGQIV